MPRYIQCVTEGTSLSKTRYEAVWKAVIEKAVELIPENEAHYTSLLRRHEATTNEIRAWLAFFFKLRDHRPAPLSPETVKYFTPSGVDTVGLAKFLRTTPERAAILVRKADKALLLSTTEEILRAVQHSHQERHQIELRKP
ncbi:MAG: hypothetical protein NZ920_00230 [Aigarchaeota archaeon]|nr:hypothetical protein [Aigarchaeota archaeon]MDW8092763.1 hypothetical protein [Nitrososphaerota archaeon]